MKISRKVLTELYHEFYNTPMELRTEETLFLGQTAVSNKNSKPCILALDEYNRAAKDVLNSTMQLVLEKKLHQHVLPTVNGVATLIVAMVNPDDGNYDVTELDIAQGDRWLEVDADVDTASWLAYAKSIKLNEVVRSYIADNPEHLYDKAKKGKWTTPRGWVTLAKQVDIFDQISPEMHFPIISGIIGQSIAVRFEAYLRNYTKVIKIEDIAEIAEKEFKKSKDIYKTAELVKEFIEDKEVEVLLLTEKVHQMVDKYLAKSKEEIDINKSVTLYATLHALDLEVLAGILHHYKKESEDNKDSKYSILAHGDSMYHKSGKKELFIKLASAARK